MVVCDWNEYKSSFLSIEWVHFGGLDPVVTKNVEDMWKIFRKWELQLDPTH